MLWGTKAVLIRRAFCIDRGNPLAACIIYVLLKPAEKDYLKHVGRTFSIRRFHNLASLKMECLRRLKNYLIGKRGTTRVAVKIDLSLSLAARFKDLTARARL